VHRDGRLDEKVRLLRDVVPHLVDLLPVVAPDTVHRGRLTGSEELGLALAGVEPSHVGVDDTVVVLALEDVTVDRDPCDLHVSHTDPSVIMAFQSGDPPDPSDQSV
jgi:hypothetical protein